MLLNISTDHPGRCFSFNNNEFFNVNETWNINGVCAMAECMALPINQDGQLGLFEQVGGTVRLTADLWEAGGETASAEQNTLAR